MTNQQNERSNNGKRIVLIMLAILLIAAIAFGAYTYSKYVTSKEGTDSAKVAKWGFEVTIDDSNNGFSTMYGTDGTSVAEEAAASAVVKGSSNVVAPGTNGNVISFTINGTAEVNAELTATLDNINDVSLTLTKDITGTGSESTKLTYNPVKWTLASTTKSTIKTGTLSEVAAAIAEISEKVKAGKSFGETYTISWSWAFDGQSLTVTDGTTINGDALDTILGQIASKGDSAVTVSDYKVTDTAEDGWTVSEYSVDVGFTLSVEIAQINEAIEEETP